MTASPQQPATPRLCSGRMTLVPLDARQIAARITSDDFTLPMGELGRIRFGPDHPGQLLPLYPLWLAALPVDGRVLGTWTAVLHEAKEAVGSVGIKGPVTGGLVEIGYGFVPAFRGQGLATEAVGAVCRALLGGMVELDEEVRAIAAETRIDNPASQKVLANCGFRRTGERHDPHDGQLLRWQLSS